MGGNFGEKNTLNRDNEVRNIRQAPMVLLIDKVADQKIPKFKELKGYAETKTEEVNLPFDF